MTEPMTWRAIICKKCGSEINCAEVPADGLCFNCRMPPVKRYPYLVLECKVCKIEVKGLKTFKAHLEAEHGLTRISDEEAFKERANFKGVRMGKEKERGPRRIKKNHWPLPARGTKWR